MNNFDDLFEQQPQKEAAPQKPEGQKERPKRQWTCRAGFPSTLPATSF